MWPRNCETQLAATIARLRRALYTRGGAASVAREGEYNQTSRAILASNLISLSLSFYLFLLFLSFPFCDGLARARLSVFFASAFPSFSFSGRSQRILKLYSRRFLSSHFLEFLFARWLHRSLSFSLTRVLTLSLDFRLFHVSCLSRSRAISLASSILFRRVFVRCTYGAVKKDRREKTKSRGA